MTTTQVVAQILGIAAMLFNIVSYQGKNQRTVIALQFFGGVLFGLNYLLLGAAVGALLNFIGVVRATVFLLRDKLKTDQLPWTLGFTAVYLAVYVLNFTVFGKEPTAYHLIIELLPVVGMMSLHIGFLLKKASAIRKCGLVSSPAWLTYNIVVGSWGGILCEMFTLISIFVGMLRHDKKDTQ